MAIYPKQNCKEICQEIRPFTCNEIRIITNKLHLNCAKYELQTWLTPPQGSRVLALGNSDHVWRMKPVAVFTPSNVICVLAFDLILSVLNIALNMTCAETRNSCGYVRLTVYLYWIWAANM